MVLACHKDVRTSRAVFNPASDNFTANSRLPTEPYIGDPQSCRLLWQSVLLCAVADALCENPSRDKNTAGTSVLAKHQADSWIRGNGRWFRQVCDMAGMDPKFVRDAYIAGRIDRRWLKPDRKMR